MTDDDGRRRPPGRRSWPSRTRPATRRCCGRSSGRPATTSRSPRRSPRRARRCARDAGARAARSPPARRRRLDPRPRAAGVGDDRRHPDPARQRERPAGRPDRRRGGRLRRASSTSPSASTRCWPRSPGTWRRPGSRHRTRRPRTGARSVERAAPAEAAGPRSSTPNAASTRIEAAAIEASRSPAPNSPYTTSGRVWVRPAMLPANMIVAPNSPSARAQLITRPAASAALASGTVIQRNDLALGRAVDPGGVLEVAIDARRSRCAPSARRTARPRTIWARTTAIGRERDRDPEELERRADAVRAGRTRAEARDRRPTAAGRSAGRRWSRAATCRETADGPGRTRAAARAATVRTRLTAVVPRLSDERLEDDRIADRASTSAPTGHGADDEHGRPAGRGTATSSPTSAREGARARASRGGWREPEATRGWPGRRIRSSQSRNARGRLGVRRRLDRDAGVGGRRRWRRRAGSSIVATASDASASVR